MRWCDSPRRVKAARVPRGKKRTIPPAVPERRRGLAPSFSAFARRRWIQKDPSLTLSHSPAPKPPRADVEGVRVPRSHLPHGSTSPPVVHGHRRRRPSREDEPAAIASFQIRSRGAKGARGGCQEGRARALRRALRFQLHHPRHPFHGAPLRAPPLLRPQETDRRPALAENHRDPLRPRSARRGRAQDHGAHSMGARRTRMGPQPDPLPVRARRRPHHARARHPRASFLSAPRGGQVRGRRARPALARSSLQSHRRRILAPSRRAPARVPRPGVPRDRRRVAFRVRLRTRHRRFRAPLHVGRERFLAPAPHAGHRGRGAEHALRHLPRTSPDPGRVRERRRRRRDVQPGASREDSRGDGREGGGRARRTKPRRAGERGSQGAQGERRARIRWARERTRTQRKKDVKIGTRRG